MLITGCSDPGSGKSASQSSWPDQKASLKGTTLTIWGASGLNTELGEPVKAFEKATGADITLVPFSGIYENGVQTKVATGDKPDLALWQPTQSQLTALNAKQNLLPIDNAPWLSKVKSQVRDVAGFLGKTRYAEVFSEPAVDGVYYNKKVFADAGISSPPKGWSEMVADAKLIKAKGIDPVFDIGGDQWGTQYIVQAQLAEAAKGGLWDRVNANKEKFTDPTIKGAIQNYKDLIDAGLLNSNLSTATFDQQVSAILGGTAGMTFMVNGFYQSMLQKAGAAKLDSTVGFFPLSAKGNIATYLPDESNGLVAFNTGNAKKEKAAKQFMEFLMGDGYAGFIKDNKTVSILNGVPSPDGVPAIATKVSDSFANSVGGMQALAVANPDLYLYLANMDAGSTTVDGVAQSTQTQFAQLAKASGIKGF
ncbi:MAG: extracellular solute-binding protein [Leifsonia sp.]